MNTEDRDVDSLSALSSVRPILKWAGGKRQLLPQIRRFYPTEFKNYFEPFVGSGAVFFDLHNLGLLGGRQSTLIDNSADLIGCYLSIRDRTTEVIRHLERLAFVHKADPHRCYYRVRDQRFNPDRHRIFNGKDPGSQRYTASLAAMLIYLNRTGYNGLFRLNSHGGFNVPTGSYRNPRICDADNLKAVATVLGANVTLVQDKFECVLTHARQGDFVYFVPPTLR